MVNDLADPVAMYEREISNFKPLTDKEVASLFQQLGGSADWDEEREAIARRLIQSHLGLVLAVAREYSSRGVSMLDLIQAGNLGLLDAVKSFADNPSGDFKTCAVASIERAIKQNCPGLVE